MGFGVSGFGWEGEGVIGASAYSSAIFGVSSANGPDPGPFPGFIAGVFGTSAENAGVIGTSYEQAGVLGYSNNNIGVYGETANSASYAGFFKGNVKVNGTLTATVKHAVVPFPDGHSGCFIAWRAPSIGSKISAQRDSRAVARS
jgi:hypothetical protein